MDKRLEARFKRMFECDTVRISSPCGKHFLIIGFNRNTKDDEGRWYKDGKPIHFDYVAEKVIASGDTMKELIASAKEYKRLTQMTMTEYLKEVCGLPA